jgi:hypothetical protein
VTQEERATRQLSDVQNLARKEQTLAKDRRQDVGVFARAHRSEENDLGIRAGSIGEFPSSPLESSGRGLGPLRTRRKSLQVVRRDSRVR